MTACISPGKRSSVTLSVTRRPPKLFCRFSRRSTGSVMASSRKRQGCADQAATREQDDENEQRPENHLPLFGQSRKPFLGQKESRRAENCAVKRADAAEQDHDDEFAGALP